MEAVKRINTLFPKYLDRQITETEWEELLVWMSALSEEELASLSHSQKFLWEKAMAGELPSTADKVNWDRVLENILASDGAAAITPVAHRVHFLKTSWFRYAAAVVLVAGATAIWYESSRSGRNDVATTNDNKQLQTDIAAGSNKALLTIGNNKPIDLASDKTGISVGSSITYNDGSSIEGLTHNSSLITHNTITTPRAGQYRAVLPDGSKVWLNAASSVRFPSKFTGDQRNIEITGEAYIEVAPNSRQPFMVKANGVDIQVLGTSFNVNAYTDEDAVRATLIEGSIKVRSQLVKPGQEAAVNNNTVKVETVNTENTISWVKGYFYFDKADIKTILRQVSRWYDVDIIYEGKITEDLFSGKMERSIPLSGMMNFLEQNNIKAKLEGKKLVIQ